MMYRVAAQAAEAAEAAEADNKSLWKSIFGWMMLCSLCTAAVDKATAVEDYILRLFLGLLPWVAVAVFKLLQAYIPASHPFGIERIRHILEHIRLRNYMRVGIKDVTIVLQAVIIVCLLVTFSMSPEEGASGTSANEDLQSHNNEAMPSTPVDNLKTMLMEVIATWPRTVDCHPYTVQQRHNITARMREKDPECVIRNNDLLNDTAFEEDVKKYAPMLEQGRQLRDEAIIAKTGLQRFDYMKSAKKAIAKTYNAVLGVDHSSESNQLLQSTQYSKQGYLLTADSDQAKLFVKANKASNDLSLIRTVDNAAFYTGWTLVPVACLVFPKTAFATTAIVGGGALVVVVGVVGVGVGFSMYMKTGFNVMNLPMDPGYEFRKLFNKEGSSWAKALPVLEYQKDESASNFVKSVVGDKDFGAVFDWVQKVGNALKFIRSTESNDNKFDFLLSEWSKADEFVLFDKVRSATYQHLERQIDEIRQTDTFKMSKLLRYTKEYEGGSNTVPNDVRGNALGVFQKWGRVSLVFNGALVTAVLQSLKDFVAFCDVQGFKQAAIKSNSKTDSGRVHFLFKQLETWEKDITDFQDHHSEQFHKMLSTKFTEQISYTHSIRQLQDDKKEKAMLEFIRDKIEIASKQVGVNRDAIDRLLANELAPGLIHQEKKQDGALIDDESYGMYKIILTALELAANKQPPNSMSGDLPNPRSVAAAA